MLSSAASAAGDEFHVSDHRLICDMGNRQLCPVLPQIIHLRTALNQKQNMFCGV